MKLKKCALHSKAVYTLKSLCPECNKPTKDAHYKFLNLKGVRETDLETYSTN